MKPRQKRFVLILIASCLLVVASVIVKNVFNDNLVFFYSPTEIVSGDVPQKKKLIRVGGMVVRDSVVRHQDNTTVSFIVSDNVNAIKVHYEGILPDLFREGKGVVAQGKLDQHGDFMASQVLAKHDENYMPPEVADLLERSKDQKILGD